MPNVTPATAGEAATSTAPRTIVAGIIARPSLVTRSHQNGRFRNPLPAAGNGRAGRQRAPSKGNIIATRAGAAAARATGQHRSAGGPGPGGVERGGGGGGAAGGRGPPGGGRGAGWGGGGVPPPLS